MANLITELVNTTTLPVYRNILQQLTPDIYGELQSGVIVSDERFSQLLTEGGQAQFVGKRAMVWLDYGYEDLQHSGEGDYMSVSQIQRREALGFQWRLDNRWTIGMGESWEADSAAGKGSLWAASGNTTHLGLMIARSFDKTDISGTISGGWNSMSSSRSGQVFAPFTAQLTRGIDTIGATGRVSHLFRRGRWHLKPMADLGLTELFGQPATETGDGPLSLAIPNYDEAHLWIRPGAEVGGTFAITDTAQLLPYLKFANRSYLHGGNTYAQATFVGAPGDASPMEVPVSLGSMFESNAGLQVALRKATLGAEYGNIRASHYNMNNFNFSLRVPF